MKRQNLNTSKWMLLPVALFALGCPERTPETPETCGGDGVICSFLGTGTAGIGPEEASPDEVQLYLPMDMTWGAGGEGYIVDWNNHRIRLLSDGVVSTFIGTGELGDAPDGDALETKMNHPTHITIAPDGNVIVSAWHNSKVMELDSSGAIEAVCGTGDRTFGGEGGPALEAIIDLPVATAFDSAGRMYIMDQGNQRIRRIEADDTIHTIVGPVGDYLPVGYIEVCIPPVEEFQAPTCRFCLEAEADDPDCTGPPARPQGFASGADGGTNAYMNQPFSQSAPPSAGMEMGPDDVLYFTDTGNHIIRALHPNGTVQTVAGTEPEPYDPTELLEKAPSGAYGGDDGPALEAKFNNPRDLAVAADGTIFVADRDNSCVRKIADGVVTTVAGVCGMIGDEGDGGPATEAVLNRPYGVALDADGNLYIADTYNHRIRVVYNP